MENDFPQRLGMAQSKFCAESRRFYLQALIFPVRRRTKFLGVASTVLTRELCCDILYKGKGGSLHYNKIADANFDSK